MTILLTNLRLTCHEQLSLHEPTEIDGHVLHTDDPSASQRDCEDPFKMTHTIFAFSTRCPIATRPFPALRPAETIEQGESREVSLKPRRWLRAAWTVAASFASCTPGVGRLPWRRKKLHEQQRSFAEQPAHLGVGMDGAQG